jgi:lysophospholipase L1-like esterase
MIGTNNLHSETPDEIAQGVSAILDELRRRMPRTRVLLLGIFPRGRTPNAVRDRLLSTNQKIARLADGSHVRFLDIGKSFLNDDGSISPDIMPDRDALPNRSEAFNLGSLPHISWASE